MTLDLRPIEVTILKMKPTSKTKPRIITDPAVLRRICLNQPRYSSEFVERSVLEGVRSKARKK